MRKVRIHRFVLVPPQQNIFDLFRISTEVVCKFVMKFHHLWCSQCRQFIKDIVLLQKSCQVCSINMMAFQHTFFPLLCTLGSAESLSLSALPDDGAYECSNSACMISSAAVIQSGSQPAFLKYFSLWWGCNTNMHIRLDFRTIQ
jgi:hypothetical protein